MSSAACQTASMSAQVVFCGEVLKAKRASPTLPSASELALSTLPGTHESRCGPRRRTRMYDKFFNCCYIKLAKSSGAMWIRSRCTSSKASSSRRSGIRRGSGSWSFSRPGDESVAELLPEVGLEASNLSQQLGVSAPGRRGRRAKGTATR